MKSSTKTSSISLGLIVFCNSGGLAIQTRRLAELLKPDKILLIDSRGFSPNKQHHLEWYPPEKTQVTTSFPPRNYEILQFIKGLTHVFTCENPYNFYLVLACQRLGIKVICQTNYEFCENLDSPHLPVPDLFLMPSHWMVDEMKARFGEDRVRYLPPPIDPAEFEKAREENVSREYYSQPIHKAPVRFLHIVGTLAWQDRNGTLDLLASLPFAQGDFELVIKSQHELPPEYACSDPRVTFEIGNVEKNSDLYFNFDALILPRRYGGLSLSTNEALMSALPVLMPDISPNNKWLPKEWLVPATKKGEFRARAMIEYFQVDPQVLAKKIDEWIDVLPSKYRAYSIGCRNFSSRSVESDYEEIFI